MLIYKKHTKNKINKTKTNFNDAYKILPFNLHALIYLRLTKTKYVNISTFSKFTDKRRLQRGRDGYKTFYKSFYLSFIRLPIRLFGKKNYKLFY